MYKLGTLYYTGLGVGQSAGQAKAWLERAAAAGSVEAMTSLGRMYEKGLGVPVDMAMAESWYKRAASPQ